MLNFYSVAEILIQYTNIVLTKNKNDFIYALFNSFLSSEDCKMYIPDESTISRWLNGKRDLPMELKVYYNSNHKQNLHNDVELKILPEIIDCAKVIEKLKKLISSDITISYSKRKELARYKSAADFLTELIYFAINRTLEIKNNKSVSTKDIILNCVVPKSCKHFCGRNDEIENLHTLISENSKIFLQGIAGIGKSELAKFYAVKHKKYYTNILYFVYSGSLKNDIAYMNFVDDTQDENINELCNKHFKFLQALEYDTLIIVDNFDTNYENESFLSKLMDLKCKILFTSKHNWLNETTMTLTEISDKEMFLNIAEKFYGDAHNYSETIMQIADAVHYHTFAFEMAIRLLEKGIDKPPVLLKKIQNENVKLTSTDKIKASKDGANKKAVYYEHIRTLFSMQKLSAGEIKVIRCCAFISQSGIDARFFSQLVGLSDLNIINNLDEYGFIKFDNGQISMHPIIQEISLAETKPSVKNCRKFLYNIRQRCLRFGEDMRNYTQFFMMIENIINYIFKDNLHIYLIFLKDTFQYMEKYRYEYGMMLAVDEMDCTIQKIIMRFPEDVALMLDCKATIAEIFNKDINKALEYSKNAVSAIQKITKKNALLVSNINANLGRLYAIINDYDNALKYMDIGLNILDDYKINNHDLFVQICNYASVLSSFGVINHSLKMINYFCDKLNNPNTQLDYAILLEMTGNIYYSVNSRDKAISYYKKALQIYQNQFDSKLFDEKVKEIYRLGINPQMLLETKTE